MYAGWYWQKNGLNTLADRGELVAITKAINGGTNCLADRTALGVVLGSAATWTLQDNAYGKVLARQSAGFADERARYGKEREDAVTAALDKLKDQQDQRRALEDRLRAQDETHYTEMQNAQNDRTRLRDRLATAELRLSVLIAQPATGGDSGVRKAAGAVSLVDGSTRAELDPAHAQRIVGIVGDGDDGLRALQACQAYVAELTN
ncbi:lysis system i-spanin subunit Rz [Pseudomonas sp. DTU_2021_1001937_2_SI_NGA_ILE_001]|uniref:lysis system i-spanin subunit Rz n=1 Tax=Pseudomonas sp. DTU_2021_1001937_2_SI_NGA_ILE_001 TaxID=3077589 RepID=UPI0028FC1043|nr:lysis system i-spanin subunit Rz [Pseudomonas sp. DTU_2021_1001937_2_SI_NGA_ILE_001]WNW14066.1 lysis system i-spanin subunit Rz [Pseudomonas sp. DTU_2021_1001937_2_SI_NGA_ILE_001]